MPNTRAALGRWGALIGAGLVLGSVVGCGSSGLYPVKGQLVYEDTKEPVTELAGFTVTFTSEALAKSAVGTIQEDGTFRLGTSGNDDGVAPGHYKVILTQPKPEPARHIYAERVVDPIYEGLSNTPLEADVEAKGDNQFTFALRRYKAPAHGKRG